MPPAKPRQISEHGVIGDMRTLALVATDGTIDFFCHPDLDSPTLFASLLDPDKGGFFRLGFEGEMKQRQIYLPDTNILVTRFLGEESIGEVCDFMPVDGSGRIIRRAEAIRGTLTVGLEIAPRPDYARRDAKLEAMEGGVCLRAEPEEDCVYFYTHVPLEIADGCASGQIELKEGEVCYAVFCPGRKDSPAVDEAYVLDAFNATRDYWHDWVKKGTFPAYWRELVVRSALTLKLLTSQKHGSIAAAATFGLPEVLGGERNWDYRFCWVRDAAFTLYALSRLNYYDEAEAFIHFLMERVAADEARLRVMYAMDGSDPAAEESLDHLSGYAGSQPVRVGNAAFDQLQIDIHGEFMDALYIAVKARGKPSYEVWGTIAAMLDKLCDTWHLPDQGIWESRGEPREHLSSRLMSWVALDRGFRMALRQSLAADIDRWRLERNRIQASIIEEFWNKELGAFTQYKGGKSLDAVVLLMPLVKFINPRDPMWTSTLKAVRRHLVHDCLVHRYINTEANGDGLNGTEGAFTICSFWYVEALARTGYVAEARLLFEKLHTYSNHLGLYAEELSADGEHLGNFPQALTHLSLISAAIWLSRALDGQTQGPNLPPSHMLEDPDGV
ncbi:glycoside hydrolase family 15 protein [Mangrovicella endophytica]|uniref:glycoside hydrolase family 15 protein n=1 Tax=Mangrovicella endophytica TaxID=2066697 RepID=UPI000C9E9B2A|nr:glycoside hydrolase family 15 protein [Mangrovicella endophytica]